MLPRAVPGAPKGLIPTPCFPWLTSWPPATSSGRLFQDPTQSSARKNFPAGRARGNTPGTEKGPSSSGIKYCNYCPARPCCASQPASREPQGMGELPKVHMGWENLSQIPTDWANKGKKRKNKNQRLILCGLVKHNSTSYHSAKTKSRSLSFLYSSFVCFFLYIFNFLKLSEQLK